MGWFSKKKKTIVALRTTRLNQADGGNTLANTVIGAILQEYPISKALIAEINRGYYSKVKEFYRYGENEFTEGLPQASYESFDLNNTAVLTVLSRVYGTLTRYIKGYSIEKPTPYWIAHKYLADGQGWNSQTNKFPAPADPNKKFVDARDINGTTIRIVTAINGIETYEDIPAGFNMDNDHLIVEFATNNATDMPTYVYLYDVTTKVHPEIDNKTVPATPYFPIVGLRHNKVNLESDKTTQRYKTSAKLLKKIDLRIDNLYKGIMSTEDGNDPNKVDEAFVMFGLAINTRAPAAAEYLCEYFYSLRNQGKSKAQFKSFVTGSYGPTPFTAIVIKEADFNIVISWNYIHVEEFTGQYGFLKRGGTFTNLYAKGSAWTTKGNEEYNNSELVYIHQYAKDKYRKITVHGLEAGTDIYEGFYEVNTIDKVVATNSIDQSIYIPLNAITLSKFEPLKRNDVCVDALNLTVYAVQIQYIKWYQRGKLLKIIGTIITIVVTIIYPPAGAAAASITAFLVAAITNIVMQIIIAQMIIKAAEFVGDLVGGDIAAILAVIAAVVAIVISPGNMADASALLNVVTGLQKSVGNDLIKKTKQLMAEAEAFQKQVGIVTNEIDQALKQFTPESMLNAVRDSIGLMDKNETVAEYYNRTYYNTDTTEMLLRQVTEYNDYALQLPRPRS